MVPPTAVQVYVDPGVFKALYTTPCAWLEQSDVGPAGAAGVSITLMVTSSVTGSGDWHPLVVVSITDTVPIPEMEAQFTKIESVLCPLTNVPPLILQVYVELGFALGIQYNTPFTPGQTDMFPRMELAVAPGFTITDTVSVEEHPLALVPVTI